MSFLGRFLLVVDVVAGLLLVEVVVVVIVVVRVRLIGGIDDDEVGVSVGGFLAGVFFLAAADGTASSLSGACTSKSCLYAADARVDRLRDILKKIKSTLMFSQTARVSNVSDADEVSPHSSS